MEERRVHLRSHSSNEKLCDFMCLSTVVSSASQYMPEIEVNSISNLFHKRKSLIQKVVDQELMEEQRATY